MRIVALLTVRNEALYLERCIRHLHDQGVETCVIDNDSTDGSREIAERLLGCGVSQIETLPYEGYYDHFAQLRQQEKLAASIDADWFIRQDADEIREAPSDFETLAQGIFRANAEGFNAIDFAEFVFVPREKTVPTLFNYVEELRHYYYFQPRPLHRVNAWKKTSAPFCLTQFGGHRAEFEGRKVFPEQFILRHYIGLSLDHFRAKYSRRIYSKTEVEERGWHGNRIAWQRGDLLLPDIRLLRKLESGSRSFDKSRPYSEHLFRFVTEGVL